MNAPSVKTSSAFQESFSPSERAQLQADDSQAWRQVTGILIAVAGVGVLMGVSTVALIYWISQRS